MTEGQEKADIRRRQRLLLFAAAISFLVMAGFFSVILAPTEPTAPRFDPAEDSLADKPAPLAPVQTPAVITPVATPAPDAPAGAAVLETASAAEPPKTPKTLPALLPAPDTPRVAILVADLGPVPAQARAAIEALPAEIGMGFSPYGGEQAALTQAARAKGQEIWVGVPMQPKRYPAINPGKNTLLLSQSAAVNSQNLAWALEQVPGAKAGIYNHMGSAFTASETALLPVLQSARAEGLLFADARSGLDTVGPAVAAKAGTRAILSSGFLDDTPADISRKLDSLVAKARKDGQALGLIEAKPASVAAVAAWAQSLKDKGVTLVPVSQVTR
jgi:hypothetical protein